MNGPAHETLPSRHRRARAASAPPRATPSGLSLDEVTRAWLGTRVLASRWVSGAYLAGDAHYPRRGTPAIWAVFAVWAALPGDALATPVNTGETARAIIAELQADASARELAGPALSRAEGALLRVRGASPTRAPMLEATALEWAEVARDLVRASAAERASDKLEQDASAIQTELMRLRAAVEQTMARVGRARQELKELEAGASSPGTAPRGSGTPPAADEGAAAPAGSAPKASVPSGTRSQGPAPRNGAP
jgi:hypothetical protein